PAEFNEVDTALSRLDLGNPAKWHLEASAEVSLGQACCAPRSPQLAKDCRIDWTVGGLPHCSDLRDNCGCTQFRPNNRAGRFKGVMRRKTFRSTGFSRIQPLSL